MRFGLIVLCLRPLTRASQQRPRNDELSSPCTIGRRAVDRACADRAGRGHCRLQCQERRLHHQFARPRARFQCACRRRTSYGHGWRSNSGQRAAVRRAHNLSGRQLWQSGNQNHRRWRRVHDRRYDHAADRRLQVHVHDLRHVGGAHRAAGSGRRRHAEQRRIPVDRAQRRIWIGRIRRLRHRARPGHRQHVAKFEQYPVHVEHEFRDVYRGSV